MDRRHSREQAFILLFENTFGINSTEEITENAKLIREEKISAFTQRLFDGTLNNLSVIDEKISKNLSGWNIERISRTALSVLRLATYEILFENEIPNSAAANEAVELSKKYSTPNEASYVNGVLGAIISSVESK
ncbi:MAG: transcription antitermination factor NusB [Acutalibacteraceae bacterium]